MKLNIKVFSIDSAVNVLQDWGIQAQTASLEQVLAEPFKIACVPAGFNQPENFAFDDRYKNLNLREFDLVIVSDIEQQRASRIVQWADQNKIKNYIVALGATHNSESIDYERMVYRPWWMYNLMRLNQPHDFELLENTEIYWFDVLLGARRPHRDYVMLSLQKHQPLLDKCLVTYRNGFVGDVIDQQTQQIHDSFQHDRLQWPYVSPNLNNDWEVQAVFDKSCSYMVPWQFYMRSRYSVICETAFTGDAFFPTEKISKALFAKRVFVAFAPCQFLQHLKELGFKTFDSLINEDYDQEWVDLERYKKAFAQVLSLTQQDPDRVAQQVQPILDHNHKHMFELKRSTDRVMQDLLVKHIPAIFTTNC